MSSLDELSEVTLFLLPKTSLFCSFCWLFFLKKESSSITIFLISSKNTYFLVFILSKSILRDIVLGSLTIVFKSCYNSGIQGYFFSYFLNSASIFFIVALISCASLYLNSKIVALGYTFSLLIASKTFLNDLLL